MNFGLPDRTLNEVKQCLDRYPRLHWVKVYGSRAMGNYGPGSDIDLAYSGPEDITAELLTALDELPTPYLFDVTYYDALTPEGLKAHIDRVGQFLITSAERR